jgi:anti-anti-sigma factor
MSEIRRKSRADRRHNTTSDTEENRRREFPPDLKIKTKIHEHNLLLWVKNAMLANNCYALRDVIYNIYLKKKFTRVIINMEGIPYADTKAIALLLELHQKLKSKNIKLILFRTVSRVKNVMEILNLDKIFDIRDK